MTKAPTPTSPSPTAPAASRAEVHLGYLDYFRAVLVAKLEGLSEGDGGHPAVGQRRPRGRQRPGPAPAPDAPARRPPRRAARSAPATTPPSTRPRLTGPAPEASTPTSAASFAACNRSLASCNHTASPRCCSPDSYATGIAHIGHHLLQLLQQHLRTVRHHAIVQPTTDSFARLLYRGSEWADEDGNSRVS